MTPAAVQTSGPEPDLFGGQSPRTSAAEPPLQLLFTGRLAHRAHVALQDAHGAGASVPVLVIELHDVGPGHHTVTAHVPYTSGTREQAEAEAKRLRVGCPLTVSAEITGLRVFLPAASVISTTPEEGPCT